MSTFGFVSFLLNIGYDAGWSAFCFRIQIISVVLFGEELFNSMFASPGRSACLVLFV